MDPEPGPSAPPGQLGPEQLDRNLDQLLEELRVVLPGVQVILAFLLAVPFQQRFGAISSLDRSTFLAANSAPRCC